MKGGLDGLSKDRPFLGAGRMFVRANSEDSYPLQVTSNRTSAKLSSGAAMSSASIQPVKADETPVLSHEEWWALFDQLRLSQQADYAEYGGPVAFFRKERDADIELP